MHDTSKPTAWSDEHLWKTAIDVATELRTATATQQPISAPASGSLHRGLPENLRARFIQVRAALFQRGIYDPVLVRFDSATVSQASTAEIAGRLSLLAESFGSVTVSQGG